MRSIRPRRAAARTAFRHQRDVDAPCRAEAALGYKPPVEFEAERRPVAPTLNQDEALSRN
jgi:hypothetical protein